MKLHPRLRTQLYGRDPADFEDAAISNPTWPADYARLLRLIAEFDFALSDSPDLSVGICIDAAISFVQNNNYVVLYEDIDASAASADVLARLGDAQTLIVNGRERVLPGLGDLSADTDFATAITAGRDRLCLRIAQHKHNSVQGFNGTGWATRIATLLGS